MDVGTLRDELRARLEYDPTTGRLTRRSGFIGTVAGALVGCPESSGKLQATFLGKRYQVDHLVWLLETGELPQGPLRHKNGNNADDRFDNLEPSAKGRVLARARRQEAFVAMARKRFGDAHDMSRVDYVDGDTPVEMTCSAHGMFQRKPDRYLRSAAGCPTCCIELASAASRATPEQLAASRARRSAAKAAYIARKAHIYRAASKRFFHRNKHKPDYAARRCCRQLLSRVIAATKSHRFGHTDELHGYSAAEFKAHIEALFEPWMTWANHGEWHVDHIKPVAWYVRNGITDPRVINQLENLRPLDAGANIRKKDRLLSAA